MIISENHFGKENCVAYCDVLIRRNYEVINVYLLEKHILKMYSISTFSTYIRGYIR